MEDVTIEIKDVNLVIQTLGGADGEGVPPGGTAGQVLAKIDSTNFNTEWVTPTGGPGGGEANTASNVGTAGVGVFKQKTGVNLEFKKINAGSSKVTITDDTANNELDVDVVPANFTGIPQSGVTNLVSDLAGKAASVHTHAIADVTGLQTALDGKSDDSHTHIIADVTGLQTALDGKSDDSHTHIIADVTGLQTALDGKVDENASITGATKTKVTYDSKGLVTAGADATTADIADSANKRYVTDAQLVVIGNTSGVNSGDHTASNIGTAGVGVFKQKTGVDLEFKKINAGSSKVTITDDTANNEVDVDVVPANFTGIPQSGVTDLVSDLAGKAESVHTHAISDVTGLQTALDGKADDSHTHIIADVTGLQTALDGKVDENASITGATKTKITYDAKGLVTAGADATTADIADSSNKRYVTDAQLTVISNTSGTNTGDQDLSGLQPLDSDLTAIAALAPSNDDVLQCKAGAWTNRSIAQLKADLNISDAKTVGILVSDPLGDAITTGDGKAYLRIPSTVNGMNLTAVAASVSTASSSGAVTVQLRRVRSGAPVDMLSTLLTVDSGETDSSTATAAVIDTANDDLATADQIYVDIDISGTGAKGLYISLTFQTP